MAAAAATPTGGSHGENDQPIAAWQPDMNASESSRTFGPYCVRLVPRNAATVFFDDSAFGNAPRRGIPQRRVMTSARLGRPAAAVVLVALLIASWSLYFRGDWRNVDVDVYHLYALDFLFHSHQLPIEYPPLSLLPFSLTLIGPAGWYPTTFAAAMALLASAGYVAFRRFASAERAGTYAIYILAAGVGTLFFRYDLVPALVVAAAVWLISRRRFSAVYPLIAIGALLKVFPIVLLPVAFIAQWTTTPNRVMRLQSTAIGVLSCLGVIALVFVVARLLDPNQALSSITYAVKRPIEVESLPATLMWFVSLGGVPLRPDDTFSSWNVSGPASSAVMIVADVALIAGLSVVYWRQVQGRLSSGQAVVGALLVLLTFSKVLSPQYFVWLAPSLALIAGFHWRWLFLFLITDLIFPTLWQLTIGSHEVTSFNTLLLAVIAVRNVFLLLVTVAYLRSPGRDLEADHDTAKHRAQHLASQPA